LINLEFKEENKKTLIVLHENAGQETPYYYIGDKLRLAYMRVGNETTVTDRLQLKVLVMKGAGRTFGGYLLLISLRIVNNILLLSKIMYKNN
jgi:hypothetical protein